MASRIVMRRAYARALPAAWKRIARVFVALGDPHRQRVLLMFEPGERLNVGQIVAASTPCGTRSRRCRNIWTHCDKEGIDDGGARSVPAFARASLRAVFLDAVSGRRQRQR